MKKQLLLLGALFSSALAFSQDWEWDAELEAEDHLNIRDIAASDENTVDVLYAVGQFKDWLGIGSRWICTNNRSYDGFVAQYDLDGNIQWIIPFGTDSDQDEALAVTTDRGGNAYITGYISGEVESGNYVYRFGERRFTTSQTYINTPKEIFYAHGSGKHRPFVAKVNASGNVVWFDVIDAIEGKGTAIALAPGNDGSNVSPSFGTNGDLYVAGTYKPNNTATTLTLDQVEFSQKTGGFSAHTVPTVGTYGSNTMAFVCKYQTNTGSAPYYAAEWANYIGNTYSGTTREVVIKGIAVEFNMNNGYSADVFVTGYYVGDFTCSTSYGALSTSSPASTYEGFIGRLQENGGDWDFVHFLESNHTSGGSAEEVFGVATSLNAYTGEWYVTGNYISDSRELILTNPQNGSINATMLTSSNGGSDIFVIEFDRDGVFDWGVNYGSSDDDYASDIQCFDYTSGYLAVAGLYSDGFNIGSLSLSAISSSTDHFIARIDEGNGNPYWAKGIDAHQVSGDNRTRDAGPRIDFDATNGDDYLYHSGMFTSSESPTLINTFGTTYNTSSYLGKISMCNCPAAVIDAIATTRISANVIRVVFNEPASLACIDHYEILIDHSLGQSSSGIINPSTAGGQITRDIDIGTPTQGAIQVMTTCESTTNNDGPVLKKKESEGTKAKSNVIIVGSAADDDGVSVYPNPADNELQLFYSPAKGGDQVDEIRVFDLNGKEISVTVKGNNDEGTQFRIDTSVLKPGTYVLRIKTGDQMRTRKITVQ